MSHRFRALDSQFSVEWKEFEQNWKNKFGKTPTVESIIFLIGIQESCIFKDNYEKEEKKDLMHVGVCSLLSQEGYYTLDFIDKEGWPHFKKIKEFEDYSLEEQENILQKTILTYFTKNKIF